MASNLMLSHQKDTEKYVLEKSVVEQLENYQVQALRFLFKAFRAKKNGVILNEDTDMNFELQIASFLNVVCDNRRFETPILILCDENNYLSWHYHIKKYSGLDVYNVTEHNIQNLFEKNEQIVMLVTGEHIKILQDYQTRDFFIIVVNELEDVVTKRIFNNLAGDFHIGLTTKNFFASKNQKLKWKMLHWVDPDCVGKYAAFCKNDDDAFANQIDLYDENWFRLTWDFNSSFKKVTKSEHKAYSQKIKNWALSSNITIQPATKRKSSRRSKQEKPPKRSKSPGNKNSSVSSSDSTPNKLKRSKRKTNLVEPIQWSSSDEFESDISIPPSQTKHQATHADIKLTNKLFPSPKKSHQPKLSQNSLRKFKSFSHMPDATLIDDFVLDEFSKDFIVPQSSQTMRKHKSCSSIASNMHAQQKEFEMKKQLESKNTHSMIMASVTDFFNFGKQNTKEIGDQTESNGAKVNSSRADQFDISDDNDENLFNMNYEEEPSVVSNINMVHKAEINNFDLQAEIFQKRDVDEKSMLNISNKNRNQVNVTKTICIDLDADRFEKAIDETTTSKQNRDNNGVHIAKTNKTDERYIDETSDFDICSQNVDTNRVHISKTDNENKNSIYVGKAKTNNFDISDLHAEEWLDDAFVMPTQNGVHCAKRNNFDNPDLHAQKEIDMKNEDKTRCSVISTKKRDINEVNSTTPSNFDIIQKNNFKKIKITTYNVASTSSNYKKLDITDTIGVETKNYVQKLVSDYKSDDIDNCNSSRVINSNHTNNIKNCNPNKANELINSDHTNSIHTYNSSSADELINGDHTNNIQKCNQRRANELINSDHTNNIQKCNPTTTNELINSNHTNNIQNCNPSTSNNQNCNRRRANELIHSDHTDNILNCNPRRANKLINSDHTNNIQKCNPTTANELINSNHTHNIKNCNPSRANELINSDHIDIIQNCNPWRANELINSDHADNIQNCNPRRSNELINSDHTNNNHNYTSNTANELINSNHKNCNPSRANELINSNHMNNTQNCNSSTANELVNSNHTNNIQNCNSSRDNEVINKEHTNNIDNHNSSRVNDIKNDGKEYDFDMSNLSMDEDSNKQATIVDNVDDDDDHSILLNIMNSRKRKRRATDSPVLDDDILTKSPNLSDWANSEDDDLVKKLYSPKKSKKARTVRPKSRINLSSALFEDDDEFLNMIKNQY